MNDLAHISVVAYLNNRWSMDPTLKKDDQLGLPGKNVLKTDASSSLSQAEGTISSNTEPRLDRRKCNPPSPNNDTVEAAPHGALEYQQLATVEDRGLERLPLPIRSSFIGQDVKQTKKEQEETDLNNNLPFPIKLYCILSNPTYQKHITWLPHGRAWKINNHRGLEDDVIPKFFRSQKYASFMRQVNGWAFTRITEGPDHNSYYHEMFLRGLPQLCTKMKRPPKVKSAAALARNLSGAAIGTPDFYRISRIAPLPPMAVTAELPTSFDLLETQDSVNSVDVVIKKSAATVAATEGNESNAFGTQRGPIVTTWETNALLGAGATTGANNKKVQALDGYNSNSSSSCCDSFAGNAEALCIAESPLTALHNPKSDQNRSTGNVMEVNNQKTQYSDRLSDADITYLAHQNRILSRYFPDATKKGLAKTPKGSQT